MDKPREAFGNDECWHCGQRHPVGQECDQPPRRTLSDGTQIYPEHRSINPATGQQKGYVVLAEEERAKGFVDALLRVRPLGGSELFIRVGEEFYADPDYCGAAIDKLRADLHESRLNIARPTDRTPPTDEPISCRTLPVKQSGRQRGTQGSRADDRTPPIGSAPKDSGGQR